MSEKHELGQPRKFDADLIRQKLIGIPWWLKCIAWPLYFLLQLWVYWIGGLAGVGYLAYLGFGAFATLGIAGTYAGAGVAVNGGWTGALIYALAGAVVFVLLTWARYANNKRLTKFREGWVKDRLK